MSPAKRPEDALLSLRSWAAEAEAAAGIARALAPTAFVPDSLRVYLNPAERNPDRKQLDVEGTVQQVTAVLLAGQELEFGPMASLRAFVIIRGTVAMYAIAARALLLRHGHEVVVKETTSTRAIVVGRRAGSDIWQTSTWDLDRARTAGLYPGHPDGNWRKQPKAMMVARATAEAARWVAADAMLGLPLIAEELADGEVIPAGPVEDLATQAAPEADGHRTTRRRSSRAAAALPAGPPSVPPAGQPPHPAGSAPPAPEGPKVTKPMLGKLHAGLRDIGITGREEGLALVGAWAGRAVESTGELTRDEAKVVLERLDALRGARERDQGEDQHPGGDDPGPEGPADPEGGETPDAEPDGH